MAGLAPPIAQQWGGGPRNEDCVVEGFPDERHRQGLQECATAATCAVAAGEAAVGAAAERGSAIPSAAPDRRLCPRLLLPRGETCDRSRWRGARLWQQAAARR